MTCGRGRNANRVHEDDGAAASHSAELARGDFPHRARPPHPPFGHLLPKGRREVRQYQG